MRGALGVVANVANGRTRQWGEGVFGGVRVSAGYRPGGAGGCVLAAQCAFQTESVVKHRISMTPNHPLTPFCSFAR